MHPLMPFPLSATTLRHSKAKFNGMGELQIGGEVKSLLPRAMARLIHPLHTRATLYVRLPIQFTGGCIQELSKGPKP